MSMKLETHKNIMSVIESFHGRNYECEKLLQEKFPDIMPETLRSIYEIFYQRKMKKIHAKFHRSSKDLYKRYKAAVENRDPVGILVRMSDEIELSPALLARMVVEEYYKEAEEEYITKVVDESDNSGRRNASFRFDDGIRSDDAEFNLSDDDNTGNSSASASNTDSKASDEVVQKDSQKQQAGTSGTKSLDAKLSSLNESFEMKLSISENVGGSKKDNKYTREKHKVVRSNTAEKSDTQTKTAAAPAVATTAPAAAAAAVAAAAPAAAAATTTAPVPAAAAAPAAKEEEYIRIKISDLINDTTLIKDKDLAYEVFLCHVEDDQYGPVIDCYRQSLGHHYEARLLQWVKKNNLVVQDEAALRKFGFDKTPDIKLDLPIAVNGAPIMWIESKAIFGDEEIHQTYYNDQYIRYWNRFGPGLVIYWLGYLETIATVEERRIMIRHDLPADIKKYSPNSIRVRKFTEKPFGVS